RRARGQQHEQAGGNQQIRTAALDGTGCAFRRDDGHDLGAAGVPVGTGACLVLDVARWPAAQIVQPGASPISYAGHRNLDRRIPGRNSRRDSRHWHALRPVKYRHSVRVCPGVDRSGHFAAQAARAAPRISRSRRPGGAHPQCCVLRAADVWPTHLDLAAFLRVAGHRAGGVHALQPPSQRVQPAARRAGAECAEQALSMFSNDFILGLPKAEIHLHLEGAVDPPTLAELSRRHPTPLPSTNNRYKNIEDSGRVFSEEEARALYEYQDFTGFLVAFKAVTERLRTAADYELVTYRMMQKLHAQNVLHAEVYISAGVVQWRGQEFAPLFEGAERGRQRGESEFGMSLYWIFDAVRHFGVDEARRVVEEAIRFKQRNVAGIGIGGDERRAAPEQFRDVYEHAAQHGLRLTVHAGETLGADSIWGALRELKPDRIGHGLHASDDPELVRYLVEKQIPVEV